MQLLDAALAFALTMLALATIATILIEIVHRLTLWRARGLRDMLGKFYDSEIKGWVQANLPAVPGGPEKVKQELLDQLMANPMVPEGKRKHLHNLVNVLSTREFLRRLGESEVGRKLKEEMTRKTEEAKKKLEDTVDRLMTRYEEFGAAASALFKRRAQVMSFIAGVVLAFIANVDGVLIFDTFIQDPELRSQVLANKATVMAQWEQVDQGYRGLLEADELPEAGANVEAIRRNYESFRDELASLEASGVPIGYRFFPQLDPDASPLGQTAFWTWLLKVLLTGCMIGLGGPFWFDVVKKLSRMATTLRGGKGEGGDRPAAEAGRAGTPSLSLPAAVSEFLGIPALGEERAELPPAPASAEPETHPEPTS